MRACVCVCVCVRVCVRACARVCVRARVRVCIVHIRARVRYVNVYVCALEERMSLRTKGNIIAFWFPFCHASASFLSLAMPEVIQYGQC